MTHSTAATQTRRFGLVWAGVIQVERKLAQTNSGLSSLKLNFTRDSGKFKGPVKTMYKM